MRLRQDMALLNLLQAITSSSTLKAELQTAVAVDIYPGMHTRYNNTVVIVEIETLFVPTFKVAAFTRHMNQVEHCSSPYLYTCHSLE